MKHDKDKKKYRIKKKKEERTKMMRMWIYCHNITDVVVRSGVMDQIE